MLAAPERQTTTSVSYHMMGQYLVAGIGQQPPIATEGEGTKGTSLMARSKWQAAIISSDDDDVIIILMRGEGRLRAYGLSARIV